MHQPSTASSPIRTTLSKAAASGSTRGRGLTTGPTGLTWLASATALALAFVASDAGAVAQTGAVHNSGAGAGSDPVSAAKSTPANAKRAKSTSASAPSARAIMDEVARTRQLAGSEAVVTMTIDNGKGQKRVRKLSLATKTFDGGKTEKRIYRFLAPADVKGSGVLVFDYETKEDDTWVYLPALRKTRRIVSSKKSKKFMGSEFAYADLNFPNLSDFEFTIKGEETVAGVACHVIESTPKTASIAKDEGYARKTFWVAKSDHTIRRGLYYDLKGKLLKELSASDIKLLDPANKRYRTMRLEMKNHQNGRVSVFHTDKVAFAPSTKDEYFTTRFLERP